ncbi:MAG: biotin/lipoate A/B protein ligase family protein [Gemmataceae bacterium]
MIPALEQWPGAGWEVISEAPYSPAVNLAVDEVVMRQVQEERRPPTLRFWGWSCRAVIIGRFQSVRNEIDLDAAKEMGVEVARRISGGGAMFVEPEKTITYSLYMPERLLAGLSIKASYEACDSWAVACMQSLGVEARYAPLNDIISSAGKMGGAAQARKPGVVLHHTTIAYQMDPQEMMRLLRIGRERLSAKGIPSAAKQVDPLRRQTDLPRPEVVSQLIDCFRKRFGLEEGRLSEEDLRASDILAREQYGTEKWMFELP